MPNARTGRCNCGAVRLSLRGEPKRTGICHCQTCRRETGSAFLAFAVWSVEDVEITGQAESWKENAYRRFFCPACGGSVFGIEDGLGEVDVRLGCLDAAPSSLTPSYELWIGRREHWLPPVAGADQQTGNRP